MVDHDPTSLSPYERLRILFESAPLDGVPEDLEDFRKIILEDETEITFDIEKSDDQPERAIGATVITKAQIDTAERLGNIPEFFRFVVSETGKGLNYIQIPSQTVNVSGTILKDPLVLGPKVIFHNDPSVSEAMIGWIDGMNKEGQFSYPPVSMGFQE